MNYEQFRKSKPKPFSFMLKKQKKQRTRGKRDLLINVDVNVAPGKSTTHPFGSISLTY